VSEREALLGYLDSQRRHVLGILEGLSEDDLRRPVLPTGWSCVQLVNHLTFDDERFWFQGVVAADPAVIAEVDGAEEDGWHIDPDASPSSILRGYQKQIERSNELLAQTELDAPPGWWPSFFGEWRLDDTREVILHVLVETSVHAGHLDAARELIDGKTWLVLE
jgi:hypothetical protein